MDLFHHRFISLFYRAWASQHVAAAYERGEDCLRDHLMDLVGMGLGAERDLLPVPDDALVFYAGLLAPRTRSAAALEQLIEDYFGHPATVEQFVGGWFPVAAQDQCPVGEEMGASTQLGRGAVVGDAIWDQQMRARLRIGPLRREEYDRFLPGGGAHEPLRALLRFFAHDQFDWELQLVLARDEVPGFVLGAEGPPQPLGWSTWLRTRDFPRDADDTVLKVH